MYEARAFWVAEPGRGEIREAAIPAPGAGEVLVDTLYSGLSRGTETLVFQGRVPAAERERMRAPFQEGQFPAPVKYGYCNVGRVAAGPADLVGRNVFTLYPHQTRFVVPAQAVTVIPGDVPPGRAVLAANLETAVNALWDARPAIGDRVAVVGAGTVGCLCAWLARGITGTQVELIDIDAARGPVAERLDVPLRAPESATAGADVVIHASGSAAGLETAIALAGFETTVVELSWYGDGPTAVPLGGRFHSQRLALRSSQVGSIANSQRNRWDHARRMALVLRLLRADCLDSLISGESAFDELPGVFEQLAAGSLPAICHRITYS